MPQRSEPNSSPKSNRSNASSEGSKPYSSPNSNLSDTSSSDAQPSKDLNEPQNLISVSEFIQDYSKKAMSGSEGPSLRASSDRPGRDGVRDRLKRRRRLESAIQLDVEQLGFLLKYIYDHETSERINWDPEILYTYVPPTFETTTVSEVLASEILRYVIITSLFAVFPRWVLQSLRRFYIIIANSSFLSTHTDVTRLDGDHRIFVLLWTGDSPPQIPTTLQNLPNLRLVEEAPRNIELEVARPGSKLNVPQSFSPRNDDIAIGTLGFFGVLENLGCSRHVVATAGHAIDESGTDGKTHLLQPVPRFDRTLGVPRFRCAKPRVDAKVTLDEVCLLETAGIPRDALRCSFSSIDCNWFIPPPAWLDPLDVPLARRDPKLGSMKAFSRLVNRQGKRFTVHKVGASTGYTTGTLCGIVCTDGIVPISQLNIEWNSPETPFALDGDSGSLVWARDGETIIQLGVHIGSEDTTSFSLSLWSFCQEISDSFDADLFLCSSDVCGKGSVWEFA